MNCLIIQNCTEVWRDKKGCDDVSGVWGEVGVWWDFEVTKEWHADDADASQRRFSQIKKETK